MSRRMIFFLAAALVSLALIVGMVGTAGGQGSAGGPTRIIFMHHSTGWGLIWQGGVREALTDLGYEFWDHDYNDPGLTGPDGELTGENWDVPDDNTDPNGWHDIFAQRVTDPPQNTFSHMLTFDVIIFKSCFPNADIQSEEQFEEYRGYFLDIRDVIDQHPDRLFIALTIPPLTPNSTSPEAAARARRWAEYLTSDEFLEGHPNLAVFDFYSLLADENGFLRAEYRPDDEYDSHPNERANATIGPIFVEFVDQAIRDFVPGEAVAQPEAPSQPQEPAAAVEVGDVIEDFEGRDLMDRWWTYVNNPDVTAFACTQGGPGYSGEAALQIAFRSAQWNTAGCGTDLESGPAWAAADGLSFFWQADTPALPVNVGFLVNDPAHPDEDDTLFEVQLETPARAWTWERAVAWWEDLVKPDWFGDAGLDAFDPANVRGIVFNVGSAEERQGGTIWIDDLRLAAEE